MKKLTLVACALACAASAFAQGTVQFNNRVTGSLITYVYLGGNSQIRGNSATDTPTGNRDWTGYTKIAGSGFVAALLAANGSGQAESALQQAAPTTTFRTGGAAGNVASTTATLVGVPANASVATIEMVAWDNSSGLYSTWAQAFNAWQSGLIAAGTSGTFDVSNIGGTQPAPVLAGLQSFNIYTVPEPATMALVGLGAAAMLIFRRRK